MNISKMLKENKQILWVVGLPSLCGIALFPLSLILMDKTLDSNTFNSVKSLFLIIGGIALVWLLIGYIIADFKNWSENEDSKKEEM